MSLISIAAMAAFIAVVPASVHAQTVSCDIAVYDDGDPNNGLSKFFCQSSLRPMYRCTD